MGATDERPGIGTPSAGESATQALAAEREARWQAAENAERLTRLVTALPAAVLVEDERRRVVLVNDSFCDVFRLPAAPAELVGTEAESVMAQIKHIAADP